MSVPTARRGEGNPRLGVIRAGCLEEESLQHGQDFLPPATVVTGGFWDMGVLSLQKQWLCGLHFPDSAVTTSNSLSCVHSPLLLVKGNEALCTRTWSSSSTWASGC